MNLIVGFFFWHWVLRSFNDIFLLQACDVIFEKLLTLIEICNFSGGFDFCKILWERFLEAIDEKYTGFIRVPSM